MRLADWRWRVGVGVVGWVLVGAPVAGQPPPPPPAALTEVQRLKADNLRLRYALLTAQQQALQEQATKLELERRALEDDFRTTLRPPAAAIFNWQTLGFDVPPAPPPAPPAKPGGH